VYHGVSDPIFSVDDTTAWYRKLTQHSGKHHDRDHRGDDRPRDVVRLFHVPGMGHCAGGPSTDQFDLLAALVDWVEKRRSPDAVVASARGPGNIGGVNGEVPAGWAPDRSRPLCAYPRVARYQGGDVERAASFVCK
jgi:feruloyl esterase